MQPARESALIGLQRRVGNRAVLRQLAQQAPTEESWSHVYSGEERNLSFDYVVAGISHKSGGKTTERTILVAPGQVFKPPSGWDLDCFIRRDGTAIKFRGVAAYVGMTKELTATQTRSEFPQYVTDAATLLSLPPATIPEGSGEQAAQLRRAAAGSEGDRDALRDLAARPWDAILQWKSLPGPSRVVLVTYMTMLYDVDFATRFRLEAERGAEAGQSIRITNVPHDAPEQLAEQGYRLRKSTPAVLYFVHPLGREVWFIPPGPAAPPRSPSAEKEAARDNAALVAARKLLDRLTSGRDDFVRRAQRLRGRALEPDAETVSEALRDQIVQWDVDLQKASDAVNTLRMETLPDYSEQIDPRLQADLEREAQRLEELDSWRKLSYPALVAGLPQPVGDSR